MKSSRPEIILPPTELAAGPENTLSTGYFLAFSKFITEPSPLYTSMGAVIPISRKVLSRPSKNLPMTEISLPLSTAVRALSSIPSVEDSSVPPMVGRPVISSAILFTVLSCEELRVANSPDTAIASTPCDTSETAFLISSSSSASTCLPLES